MFTLPAAEDLSQQMGVYLKKLDRDLEDLGANPHFSDGVDSLYRDANILLLLSLALGTSAEESPYKAAAPAIVSAAQNAAQVQDLPSAKAAVGEIKAALNTSGDPSSLQWTKVARLSPLMKKGLPNIIQEMKRLGGRENTITRKGNLDKVIGDSATLAVIALGCRPNVDETLAPNEDDLWREYCGRLYEAAFRVNQAAVSLREGTGKYADYSAAFEDLNKTCNTTCHKTFGGATN